MNISIVILSYNDFSETTGKCLASLHADPAFGEWDVIVVDNASDAATRDFLQDAQGQYSSVRFVLNESNLGYAGGNNVGMRMCTGGVVVLLNSDTVVPIGMMARFGAHFENNKKLGMVGPVTNAAGNEQAIFSSAESIEAIVEQGLSYANGGGADLLVTYRMDFHCVAISSEVIASVGLLDEDFGRGYYEDFDYSLRVKQAGFDLRVAENVFVYHRGSASFSKLPRETRELLKRNKKRIINKHGSEILFLNLRDGNLSILAQYAEMKKAGLTVPEARIQNRLEQAMSKQPRSWFKKWRYLNRVRKVAACFGLDQAL